MAPPSGSEEMLSAEKDRGSERRKARKIWTDADSALLERACASGKMDDGFPATDGRLAKELGCCRRTIIRQRQVRQIGAVSGPKEGGVVSALGRALRVLSRRGGGAAPSH